MKAFVLLFAGLTVLLISVQTTVQQAKPNGLQIQQQDQSVGEKGSGIVKERTTHFNNKRKTKPTTAKPKTNKTTQKPKPEGASNNKSNGTENDAKNKLGKNKGNEETQNNADLKNENGQAENGGNKTTIPEESKAKDAEQTKPGPKPATDTNKTKKDASKAG